MPLSASTRTHALRAGTLVAAAGIALTCASDAFAIPGDSGDLNIVEVRNAGREARANGGAICQFRLAANNFETLPAVAWTITELPLTIPPGNVLAGTLPLSQGRARSPQYQLPDGTYQLQWIVPGSLTKQRTFVVNCPDDGRGGRGGERDQSAGGQSTGNRADGNQASGATGADSEAADGRGADTGAGASGRRPSGGVPAGGGGVAKLETASYDGDTGPGAGTTAAVAAGVAGLAGLVLVRRSARRRSRGEA